MWGPHGHVAPPNWMEIQSWWIKWIRNSTNQLQLDVAKRGTKEDLSSPFGLVRAVGERGEQILKNGGFLKRESPTSF